MERSLDFALKKGENPSQGPGSSGKELSCGARVEKQLQKGPLGTKLKLLR